MTIEDERDLEGLRRVGAAVAAARDAMLAAVEPGIDTRSLDRIGAAELRRHGARSAPRLAYGFPGWTCVSVNDEAAHGIPSPRRRLREGDLVNVDVSAELDGYWADTGASRAVGTASAPAARLLAVTERARDEAIQAAVAGAPLNGIGAVVERTARRHGLRVLRNLAGHGVGRGIHEEPSVLNYREPRDRTVLWAGLVLAVEPLLSLSADHVVEDRDGWGLRTADGSLAAQFEHSIVVTDGAPLVLTA